MCLQVNYHGPYTLTRLLEPVLIASKPSRLVNVASVEHRIGYIRNVNKFMFDAKKFLYSETKLGNVLLTYEHQRRMGALGVQVRVCAYLTCIRCLWHSCLEEPSSAQVHCAICLQQDLILSSSVFSMTLLFCLAPSSHLATEYSAVFRAGLACLLRHRIHHAYSSTCKLLTDLSGFPCLTGAC